MWSIGEVKARGKKAFKSNYWKSVLVALILSILAAGTTVSARSEANSEEVKASLLTLDSNAVFILIGALTTIMIISLLLRIFLFNPLQVGGYRFFKKNVESTGADLDILKEGFSDYGNTFITLLLRDIFLALWTCLFIIPGIIKGYSYRLVPYIIKDYPELSPTEVITKSREMMNGNKGKAFLFDLSFIGWFILSIIPLVGLLWTNPYYQNANAALYLELSKNR